ncbi:MAG: hypothetical protein JWN85_4499 [Gammaproteobacteria bacterium]|nr:hypothetical protein [Gammaproteobacteria bacterium]
MFELKLMGRLFIVLGLAAGALFACASSHVMIGKARSPISPDLVQIYTQPPEAKYVEIATLDASSQWSLSFTAQGKTDRVINRLRQEAAKLGANGVVLQGVGDRVSGAIGTGLGQGSYSGNTAVSGGIGISAGLHQKIASGIAIYVEPN